MVLQTRMVTSLTTILFITWTSVHLFGQQSTTAQQTTQPSTTEQTGGTSGRDCRVDSFKLQPDFELVRLQGLWYGITINKHCNWLAIPSFLPLSQTNLQADYRLVADDQFEIHAGTLVCIFLSYTCTTLSKTQFVIVFCIIDVLHCLIMKLNWMCNYD